MRGWVDFKRDKELHLVKELWGFFDRADAVIGHNAKSFDNKWCTTRFLKYGLPPPSPYKVIDTKLEAKKYLNLPSYSLNNVADYFGLGHKIEHEGFSLWKKCMAGDKKAWKRMKRYNKQDVELLEDVYLKLRPWIKTTGVFGKYSCTNCGSKHLQMRGFTCDGRHRRAQCKNCGCWMQMKPTKP